MKLRILGRKTARLLLLATALCAAAPTFAQTDATTGATAQMTKVKAKKLDAGAKARRQAARLGKNLSLTGAQQTKVEAILKKYEGQKPTKTLREKKRKEIEAVLTDAQKAKYAAGKEAWSKARKK